mmetsp:Transcript_4669/g.7104  ORF Transcript_4669/g.7104 Transcript_4669/m.7104 type:complete len:80 (-) Transcript_4669:72-311(-)
MQVMGRVKPKKRKKKEIAPIVSFGCVGSCTMTPGSSASPFFLKYFLKSTRRIDISTKGLQSWAAKARFRFNGQDAHGVR